MSNFTVSSKIVSSLKRGFDEKPFLEIQFLGCGGAFDVLEKNSSALVTSGDNKFLIDCGPSVYPELKSKNIIGNIDVVFITHTHEDHIGSLSTLIYDKWYLHQQVTIIECGATVARMLEAYLTVCGHDKNQYVINTGDDVYYDDFNMQVLKIDTMGHHFDAFPNNGFVFNFEEGGEYFFMVYSGDINKPFIKLLPEGILNVLYKNRDDVIMFHDMTTLDYPNNPHCNFMLLEPIMDNFKNLFTYHHGKSSMSVLKDAESKLNSLSVHPDKTFVVQKKIK